MPAQTKPNNSQEPTSVIKSHACGQRRIAAPRPAAPPAATRPAPAVPPAAARLALSCAQLAPPRALLVCHVVLPPGLRLAARPANSRFGRSARPPWPLSPCRASPWPLCAPALAALRRAFARPALTAPRRAASRTPRPTLLRARLGPPQRGSHAPPL
jgi:hypothetical protein